MVPTPANASELRAKILSVLLHLRAWDGRIDVESLAHDIFLEAWEKRTPITIEFIRHRLFNATRNSMLRSARTSQSAHVPPPGALPPSEALDNQELLALLMSRAEVTGEETSVIFQVIYQGKSYSETATTLRRSERWVSDTFSGVLIRLQAEGRKAVR